MKGKMMLNEERINKAKIALHAYVEATINGSWTYRDTIENLLTDLRNWTASRGVDFDNAVKVSEDCFEAEMNPPPVEADVRIFVESDQLGRTYFNPSEDDPDETLAQFIDQAIVNTRNDNMIRRVGFEIK